MHNKTKTIIVAAKEFLMLKSFLNNMILLCFLQWPIQHSSLLLLQSHNLFDYKNITSSLLCSTTRNLHHYFLEGFLLQSILSFTHILNQDNYNISILLITNTHMHVSIHHSSSNHVIVLNKSHKCGKESCSTYESLEIL